VETIAIPTYNEGHRIGSLLASLETDAPPSVAEILVCDSASTDNTREVVTHWASRCERVRLIDAHAPGKPAAWNRLVEEAAAPVVVFLDADVVLLPGSLCRLIAASAAGPHIAYSGRRRFRPTRSGLIPGIAAWLANPVVELCLQGTCYAIHKEGIRARMRESGFARMPDVFAEDIWLNALLAPDEMTNVHDVVVEVELTGFSGYAALHARKMVVAYELRTRFPELARRLHDHYPQAMQGFAQCKAVVGGGFSFATKLRWLVGAALKLTANTVLRREIARTVRRYEYVYDENGGSYLLRHVASTSPRLHRAEPSVVS